MPTRYPPRREPRVLAVARSPNGLAFATVDPWMVRSSGSVPCSNRSTLAALTRLLRREKPTAVISPAPDIARSLVRLAATPEVTVITRAPPDIPPAIAAELYPDLPVMAPPPLDALAALAASVVLHADIPPRHYAPHRHQPSSRRRGPPPAR